MVAALGQKLSVLGVGTIFATIATIVSASDDNRVDVTPIVDPVAATPVFNTATESEPQQLPLAPSKPTALLRVGRGFAMALANDVAADADAAGCAYEITTERGFPRSIIVELDGERVGRFRESTTAGIAVEEACLDKRGSLDSGVTDGSLQAEEFRGQFTQPKCSQPESAFSYIKPKLL